MPNPSEKTDRTSMIVLVSVIIIGAVAYFLINPAISQIRSLNIKLSARGEEISQMEAKLATLNSLETQFNQVQDQVKKLGLAAPSNDQIAEILVQLETIASDSGLTLASVQPIKESNQAAVSVNANLQGNYSGLIDFIKASEKNIRPINIKSINLASATEGEGSIVDCSLGLEILKAGSSNE